MAGFYLGFIVLGEKCRVAELPRGVRGHTYTVIMITIFVGLVGGKLGIFFWAGGELLALKYPR